MIFFPYAGELSAADPNGVVFKSGFMLFLKCFFFRVLHPVEINGVDTLFVLRVIWSTIKRVSPSL